MKKSVSLLLAGLMLCGALAGCGGNDSYGAGESGTDDSAASTCTSGAITVISREDGSGTRDAFDSLIKNAAGDELGDLTQFAAVVEINNNTGTVMSNIAANKNGNTIGYISMGSLDDTVKAVTFEGVEPTAENVKNGTYTLSRPFNIVYKSEDSLSAAAKEFIDFIMSPA